MTEDPRTARALSFLEQEPYSLRFTSVNPLYNFLALMQKAGAEIHLADDPAVRSKGWLIRYPPDDDRDYIRAEITIIDFRNSSGPSTNRSRDDWDALLTRSHP